MPTLLKNVKAVPAKRDGPYLTNPFAPGLSGATKNLYCLRLFYLLSDLCFNFFSEFGIIR
jgi:hypothetical protein